MCSGKNVWWREEEQADRQNISRRDNNHRVAICDFKRNVMQISLVQSAVKIAPWPTKRRETQKMSELAKWRRRWSDGGLIFEKKSE